MYVTTTFNIKKFHVYGFQNNQRLFLHAVYVMVCVTETECLLRGTDRI